MTITVFEHLDQKVLTSFHLNILFNASLDLFIYKGLT